MGDMFHQQTSQQTATSSQVGVSTGSVKGKGNKVKTNVQGAVSGHGTSVSGKNNIVGKTKVNISGKDNSTLTQTGSLNLAPGSTLNFSEGDNLQGIEDAISSMFASAPAANTQPTNAVLGPSANNLNSLSTTPVDGTSTSWQGGSGQPGSSGETLSEGGSTNFGSGLNSGLGGLNWTAIGGISAIIGLAIAWYYHGNK